MLEITDHRYRKPKTGSARKLHYYHVHYSENQEEKEDWFSRSALLNAFGEVGRDATAHMTGSALTKYKAVMPSQCPSSNIEVARGLC